MIHQELALMAWMTVAENIWIRREPRNVLGLIDHKRMIANTRELFRSVKDRDRPFGRSQHAHSRAEADGRDRQGGQL